MIDTSLLQKLVTRIALYDDAIAYKELFLLYHPRLVSFCSSITRTKESAEEVVSDVFLKIWLNRNSLTRIENFHLYIYIITKRDARSKIYKLPYPQDTSEISEAVFVADLNFSGVVSASLSSSDKPNT